MAYAGKKITLKKMNKNRNEEVTAVLNEEVTYSIASEYTNMLDDLGLANVKGVIDKVGKFASTAASLFGITGLEDSTFVFKEASVPRWAGTQPLKLQISINLYNDEVSTDSKKNYKKAKLIQSWVLPSDRGDEEGESKWKGLKPPIPNDAESLITASRKKRSTYKKNGTGFVGVKIGNIITLPNVIIESADMTYSTDSTSEGKPLYIKMNLEMRTVGAITSSQLKLAMTSGSRGVTI